MVHLNPLHVGRVFGVFWFAHSLQPAELLASPGGPDRVRGDDAPCTKPREAFTPELAAESVTLLAVGYTTVAPGGFHWQVSHLLEPQLASLHDRRPCLSMTRELFLARAAVIR